MDSSRDRLAQVLPCCSVQQYPFTPSSGSRPAASVPKRARGGFPGFRGRRPSRCHRHHTAILIPRPAGANRCLRPSIPGSRSRFFPAAVFRGRGVRFVRPGRWIAPRPAWRGRCSRLQVLHIDHIWAVGQTEFPQKVASIHPVGVLAYGRGG